MEINRKRGARRLASGIVAGALAVGGLAISGASPAGAVPIGDGELERLAGTDRFATAAAVADYVDDFVGDIETVIVANGRNFPDALAASSLMDNYSDAVLLLVETDSIPAVTENMMNRLDNDVDDVIVVGGESAVSAEVFDDIESIFNDSDVVRISGDNRYATAAAVAEETGWNGNLVLLTSGESFADAVTVGGYAALTSNPILLANASGLPEATSDALETALDEGIERVVIIGGNSAVASSTEEALIELGFDPSGISRIAGSDRYATNLAFNLEQAANAALAINKYMDLGTETEQQAGERMVIVTGSDFPDALAAAAVAYTQDAHVVLVNPTSVGVAGLTLSGAAATSLTVDSAGGNTFVSGSLWDNYGDTHIGEEVWVVGGLNAVPDSVLTTMSGAATGNLGCAVIAPKSNDSGNGSQVVVVAFAGNLQDDNGAGGFSELDELTNDTSYIEVNGNDDFLLAGALGGSDTADLNNDGYADALVYVNTGDAFEIGDEIEFAGIEQDGDIWQDGDNYGLRNVGPCSTTIAEDDDGPDAEWWGVEDDTDFFVHFSEPMATDYSGDIEVDFNATNGDVDDVICFNVDPGTYQDYACYLEDIANNPETMGAGSTLDLDEADYLDAAGNEADFVDFDEDSLTDNPDVSIESISVTCQAVGAGGSKSTAWGNSFGYSPSFTNEALITIGDTGGDIAFLGGPGAGGLAGNDFSITITHKRGLLIPTVAVDGTAATITIDRYVHNSNDIIRVWNNSEWGRGGLAPKWIASGSFAAGNLIPVANLDEAYTSADHDAGVAGALAGLGRFYGIANRSCHFTAKLDAPLTDGFSTVTTNPASEGEFRISFGNAAQDLNAQFAGDEDLGWVIEGVIDLTEDASANVRATLFASGSRSSVDG